MVKVRYVDEIPQSFTYSLLYTQSKIQTVLHTFLSIVKFKNIDVIRGDITRVLPTLLSDYNISWQGELMSSRDNYITMRQ
jgi:hypothetical protein